MKKMLFAYTTASCMIIRLIPVKFAQFSDRYYFMVNAGVIKLGLTSFRNREVTFFADGPAIPPNPACIGSGVDCIVSFTISQVTSLHYTHLLTNLFLPQVAKTILYTRSVN